MKKITIILSALFIAAFLVTSCSKDQKSVNRLEGSWKVTKMTVDGETMDSEEYEGTSYTFEKCKVKKGDCVGYVSHSDPDKGSVNTDFTYNVSDKGENLTINYSSFGFSYTTKYEIVEQTKTKIELKSNEDGYEVIQTWEKK